MKMKTSIIILSVISNHYASSWSLVIKPTEKKYTNAHIFNANQLIKSLKKQNMRIMSVTAQTPVKIVHHVVTSTISLMHTSEMHESRAYTRI